VVLFPAGTKDSCHFGSGQALGIWVPSLKVKKPQREAGHSAPFNTDVKNVNSYAYTPRLPPRCAKNNRNVYTTFLAHISEQRHFKIDPSGSKIGKKSFSKTDETVLLMSKATQRHYSVSV
jgi:hypothetical protein